MKYVYENFVNKDEVDKAEVRGFTINVRFCNNCPLFEIDGIQPDSGITRGSCLRMSNESVPYYVNVTSNSFCNEDEITED